MNTKVKGITGNMKNKNIYLIKQNISTSTINFDENESVNRLMILDKSGSMWGLLGNVIDDISNQLDTFPDNDYISIGYFSGYRQYGWICKGMSASKRSEIRAMLNRHREVIGMTCFSEVLEDTATVIKDLSSVSPNFSLLFFSDGNPTVGNYAEEVRKILAALESVTASIQYSMFVGYGEYYNRELLNKMANTVGGMLVHSSNLSQLNAHLITFSEGKSSNKVEITINGTPFRDFAFSVQGKSVTSYVVAKGKVLVPQDVENLYYLADTVPPGLEEVTDEAIYYAAAKLLSQLGDVSGAIDCVGRIGDKAFVDALNNAFTNAEYGTVEQNLTFAVVDKKYRFTAGKDTNYLPKDDAFCLLNLLEILEETDAKFLPSDKNFVYKKVGVPAIPKEGYPKMEWEPNQEVSINAFTWNKSKLNLSLLAAIKGTVNLGEEAKKHGLGEEFPTHTFRNYTLILDGKPNVEKLPVKLTSEGFKKLKSLGLVSGKSDSVHVLDLTSIPVINRAIAQDYTSASVLSEKVLREKELEVEQKYIKYQLNHLTEDAPVKSDVLTEEQLEFLKSKGIDKNGYSVPTIKGEVTDFYYTKEFLVEVEGLKTIPKIEDFFKKMSDGKLDLTKAVFRVLSDIHALFENETGKLSEKKVIDWLENKLFDIKSELKEVRSYIQKAKFAILLAKQNFKEIPKLEEETPFKHNGTDFTFKLKSDVKVNL